MSRKSDWDIFKQKFKPIENPSSEGFFMWETYGKEYEKVQKHIEEKGNEYCWTVVDTNGKLYLIPGWHWVNRIGYILTTIPFTKNERDYKY